MLSATEVSPNVPTLPLRSEIAIFAPESTTLEPDFGPKEDT